MPPERSFFLRRVALRHHALYQACLVRNEEKHERKPQETAYSISFYPSARASFSNLFPLGV